MFYSWKENMEQKENFVITAPDTIDCIMLSRIEMIMKSYTSVSTGNQLGKGIIEYFFAVDSAYLVPLQQTLSQQIQNPKITYSIM